MSQNLFIGVGHNGLRIVSPDGRQWRPAQSGKEGEIYRAVCVGGGLCAAVGSYGGSNIFAATSDGLAWKTATKDAMYSKYARGLVFARGQFMALGGDPGSVGASHPFETHSGDGVVWTEYQEIGGPHLLRRAAFGNDRYVGVGDRGRRSASADGRAWKDVGGTRALDTLVDVAFGNGVWAGVGLNGLRMRTTDGAAWTDRQTGDEGEHLNSIVWTGDRFVAIGMGATYVSPDARQWKRLPNRNAPLTAAYGDGVFVGAQWKGRLLRSTDGADWQETLKCEHHVEAVAWGPVG